MLFLRWKLGEKWQFFRRDWKNQLVVSANFAYFFAIDLHRGQNWSQQFHLAWNPGSFFCLQIEKNLCLLTSFGYNFTEFFIFFGSSFHESLKFFGQNCLQTYKGTTSSMLLLRSCVFFTFFVVYHEMFHALYIWNFQNDQSFKKS